MILKWQILQSQSYSSRQINKVLILMPDKMSGLMLTYMLVVGESAKTNCEGISLQPAYGPSTLVVDGALATSANLASSTPINK